MFYDISDRRWQSSEKVSTTSCSHETVWQTMRRKKISQKIETWVDIPKPSYKMPYNQNYDKNAYVC
jgi:hypothetical protein